MPKPNKPRKLTKTRSARLQSMLVGLCTALSSALVIAAVRPKEVRSAGDGFNQQHDIVTEDFVLVPVPTRNAARGEPLSAIPFTTIKWPSSRLNADYLRDNTALPQAFAAAPLTKYLPVPLSALSESALESNQVTERIPQGMRAITLRVDAESAVEGWAQSGNYVDVILVRAGKDSAGGLESKVIAENVKILSAGRSAEPLGNDQSTPNPPSTVTLLVNQDDALKIKTAASLGKLTFALRGFGDQLPTVSRTLDQRTLLGTPKAAPKVISGLARGPDGQVYTLGSSARWTKTSDGPAATTELPPEANQ